MMMMMIEEGMTVAGVDTHRDTHALCVLDGLGRVVSKGSFPADAAGYDALAAAIGDPAGCLAVGVEGTASYGAGLARRLAGLGYTVREVLRPKRDRRRRGAPKSDAADAERAARDVLAGSGLSVPKSQDGWAESLRYLDIAREAAVRASTASVNRVRGMLVTAPDPIRARYGGMPAGRLMAELGRGPEGDGGPDRPIYLAMRCQAEAWAASSRQAAELDAEMASILAERAPALLAVYGCGPVSAVGLAVAAGDNPGRVKSEAGFAALCGTSPVEATSGAAVARHRLNRGGDRRANRAIHQIALVRIRHDRRTQEYMARRRSEGKSTREAIRCLKRYIAREVYKALLHPTDVAEPAGPALRERRVSLGLTQAEAGLALGVRSARISEAERGARRQAGLEERYGDWLDMMAGAAHAAESRGGAERGGPGAAAKAGRPRNEPPGSAAELP